MSKKMIGFANDYLETGNGTQAILNNYDTEDPKVAGVMAVQNLGKLSVIEYLESNAQAVASNMLKLALNAESERDQITAGKDVLDRAGFKPVDRSINVNATVDTTDNPKMKSIIEEFRSKAYEALKQDD